MDLDDVAATVKFPVRDPGSNLTAAFNAVLADAGIRTAAGELPCCRAAVLASWRQRLERAV